MSSARSYWNQRGRPGSLQEVLDISLPPAANSSYSDWADPLRAGEHSGPWLDVGCGIGRCLGRIPESAFKIGFDLSEVMLQHARKNVPSARLLQGSADQLPFLSSIFPRIVCTDLLLHLPGEVRTAALKELARVTAPGGILLITTNNDRCFGRLLQPPRSGGGYHRSHTSLEDLCSLLEPRGFCVLKTGADPLQSLLSLPARLPLIGVPYVKALARLGILSRVPYALASRVDRATRFCFPFRYLSDHLLVAFQKEGEN